MPIPTPVQLSKVQQGMIYYRVTTLIDTLVHFLVRLPKNENGYSKVAEIINNAINNQYRDIPYIKSSVNTAANEIVIARELNGIFNPDLPVLERLDIISNSQNRENTLQATAGEIREFALQVLEQYLKSKPLLKQFINAGETSPSNNHTP